MLRSLLPCCRRRLAAFTILTCCLWEGTSAPLRAQQTAPRPHGPGDQYWQPGFHLPGTGGAITTLAVAPGGAVYVGGDFRQVGGLPVANGLACWTGTTWTALGTGVAPGTDINDLAVAPNGDVYAVGDFTAIGGVAANRVARWDGTRWWPLGTGLNGEAQQVVIAGTGTVYVGGTFTAAGGQPAYRAARWDGTAWAPLGRGLNHDVLALALDSSGTLYAGGQFTTAGGMVAIRVAKWNGTGWAPLQVPYALSFIVTALAVSPSGGEVYAVGGGGSVHRWNQAGWQVLQGTLSSNTAEALVVDSAGRLYAADGTNRVYTWTGTAWDSVGTALGTANRFQATTLALAPNGGLYAGSTTYRISNLHHWNGVAWAGVGSGGLDWPVRCVAAAPGGDVYVAGDFEQAGRGPARSVARWDGAAWHPLGAGLAEPDVFAVVAGAGGAYFSGAFTQAGGVAVNGLAHWDGTAWHPLGAGVNGYVWALALAPNGDLYVGGAFNQAGGLPAHNVARWDGTAWHPLGTGADNLVSALAIGPTGEVWVAGSAIRQAGGAAVDRVARWNGTSWAGLPTCPAVTFNSAIRMTAGASGEVYVSGYDPAIHRWDGTAWTTLGTGLSAPPNIPVQVLALAAAPNGDLYVGGAFEGAGGVAARSVARWDGTAWTALGSGLAYPANNFGYSAVRALAVGPTGEVYAGGHFTCLGDSSLMSAFFANYHAPQALGVAPARAPHPSRAQLYPNPARTSVRIEGAPAATVRLLDLTGREIRRGALPGGTGTGTLDLTAVRPGVYVVQTGAQAQRLVVE